MADEDDPVIASYDVFLTEPRPPATELAASRLFVLQYPAHRKASKPYNSSRGQTPTSLRLKPNAGLVEVEVPLLTHRFYNEEAGAKYGKAMEDSRTLQAGGSHGLAGGFSTSSANFSRLRDIPMHNAHDDWPDPLQTQTLGGKIVPPSAKDPIYLLGSLRNQQLHLTHLDGVIQLRPQLHHIDAEDEKKAHAASTAAAGRGKPGFEQPLKMESKAIEVKLKDTKDDGKDRNLNENTKLLREIQVDQWRHHSWVDESAQDAAEALEQHLHLDAPSSLLSSKLKSSINNFVWLDKMSAPRLDGKKGLVGKLRGRDRERARRKKAEDQKRQRLKDAAGAPQTAGGPFVDMSSDSDLTTPDGSDDEGNRPDAPVGPDGQDVEMTGTDDDPIEIKEEPETGPSSSAPVPAPAPDLAPATSTPVPKRRGRPPKRGG